MVLDQNRTVDKERLFRKLGKLGTSEIDHIKTVLQDSNSKFENFYKIFKFRMLTFSLG